MMDFLTKLALDRTKFIFDMKEKMKFKDQQNKLILSEKVNFICDTEYNNKKEDEIF